MDDLKAREAELAVVTKELDMKVPELARARKDPKIGKDKLEARQRAIAELEEKRKTLENHRRAKSGAYMFGVLVCVTGDKFAAVSGLEMPPGFKAIAQSHGCEPIEEAATLEDLMAINPRCARGDTAAIAKMTQQWDATMEKSINKKEGYNNRPGTCAGAKLIGKSGHVARSMTEIYFSFSSDKKSVAFNVIYHGPIELAPAEELWTAPSEADVEQKKGSPHVEERYKMKRRKEISVPSCQSCQDTLFMARCDIEEQQCKK
jgi:hypothetical protein